jgi:hypothetical protein
MALLNLRQTSSEEDFKNKFDQLVYNIRLYDNHISETMLVSRFLLADISTNSEKANSLCFKYGEKYSPAHTCTSSNASAINLMKNVVADGGSFLSDELLEELETTQLHMLQTDASLSLSLCVCMLYLANLCRSLFS